MTRHSNTILVGVKCYIIVSDLLFSNGLVMLNLLDICMFSLEKFKSYFLNCVFFFLLLY